MADSEEYAKQMLKVAVCRVAQRTGFRQVDSAALDALADSAAHFIEAIGESCARFAAHTNQEADCSIDHLDSAVQVAYRRHRLNQRALKSLVRERLASQDAEYEHGILPIPAEIDYQAEGARAPLASTAVLQGDHNATSTSAGAHGTSNRESAHSAARRARILANVPPALRALLPASFTYEGTKVFASASNARLARHANDGAAGVGGGGGGGAAMTAVATERVMGGTGADNTLLLQQKKEEYYTGKKRLRASLNKIWGSTTTFSAGMDREAVSYTHLTLPTIYSV